MVEGHSGGKLPEELLLKKMLKRQNILLSYALQNCFVHKLIF